MAVMSLEIIFHLKTILKCSCMISISQKTNFSFLTLLLVMLLAYLLTVNCHLMDAHFERITDTESPTNAAKSRHVLRRRKPGYFYIYHNLLHHPSEQHLFLSKDGSPLQYCRKRKHY